MNTPIKSVFISYSRRNEYISRRVYDDLKRAGCVALWHDQESIPINSDWVTKIQEGITSHNSFLYLWSPESEASVHVQEEYRLAREHQRDIAVVMVAGTVAEMPVDLRRLDVVDMTKDYGAAFQKILAWLDVSEPLVKLMDLIRKAEPLTEAIDTLQVKNLKSWFVHDPANIPAERRRKFVSFPLLSSGYCTSWLVTDTKQNLELQSNLYIVLKFTDDGYRDTVQEVLDYLISNRLQPQILFVEGPKNDDGRYLLPDESPHVWADAVGLVERSIKSFPNQTLHFFLHAPQALSFAVASTFTPFQKYHVYNLDRDQPLGQRYKCVFSKTSGH